MLGSPKPPRGGGVNPPIDGSDKDGGGGIDIPTKEGGGGKFENVPKEGGGGKFGKIPNVGGGGKFGSDPPKEGGGGKVSDDPNEGGGGNWFTLLNVCGDELTPMRIGGGGKLGRLKFVLDNDGGGGKFGRLIDALLFDSVGRTGKPRDGATGARLLYFVPLP